MWMENAHGKGGWKNPKGEMRMETEDVLILNNNIRMYDKIRMKGMSWLQSIQYNILGRSGVSVTEQNSIITVR